MSSHIDFGTPGIVKRFRRIEVHHAPLNAGESISVSAYVDQDPIAYSNALAPVPAGATATNSVAGTTITALTFATDTVGKTLYFQVQVQETEVPPTTSPRISYISIEVGGTWVADMYLSCVARRNTAAQEMDSQGASGGDLAYLLWLAQEFGALVTFYHPNGQTYTMAVESLDGWNPSVTSRMQSQENRPRDEEYIVHAILRQVA